MHSEIPASVSFLQGCNQDELNAFGRLLEPHDSIPGERVVVEGQKMTRLFVVCEGSVEVARMANGIELPLGIIKKGGFFGEVNLFTEGEATASVYTTGDDTALASVEYRTLRAFIELNPVIGIKICSALMNVVCSRLRSMNDLVAQTAFWSAE